MNTVIKRAWNKNKLVKVEDLTGMTFQAESGGHTFEISGVDDTGAAVSLSGTVEGRFLRADNAEIIISGTVSGGKSSVTLSAACYAIPGRFLLTIYVTSGGQKVAVYAATGSVVATSGTASGSIPPLVTDSVQANTGTFGSISTGGATVNGVLDVTNRRCYATLSSPGWYRAIVYNGSNHNAAFGAGFIIDIDITRLWGNARPEVHHVSLHGVLDKLAFVDERSTSNVQYIDKIRYNVNGSTAYIDIHYAGSDTNQVCVTFDVKDNPLYLYRFVSSYLSAVSPSPSGETPLTEYTFVANSPEVQPKVMHSFSVPTSSSIEIDISGTSEASFLLSAFGWFSGFRALYYCAGYSTGSRSTANGIVTDSRIAIDFASYTGSFRFKITNSASTNAIINIMSFDPNTVFTQV